MMKRICLVIILVIVLIFFGVGKLPEIGKALGEGMKNFRSAQGEASKSKSSKEIEIEAEIEDAQETRTRSKVDKAD